MASGDEEKEGLRKKKNKKEGKGKEEIKSRIFYSFHSDLKCKFSNMGGKVWPCADLERSREFSILIFYPREFLT